MLNPRPLRGNDKYSNGASPDVNGSHRSHRSALLFCFFTTWKRECQLNRIYILFGCELEFVCLHRRKPLTRVPGPTIEGVLRYSDGKPAVNWVNFKVDKKDDKVDGNVIEKTDYAGRFTLRVLKGVTGELSSEQWLLKGLYIDCPKVDEMLVKSGETSLPHLEERHTKKWKLTTIVRMVSAFFSPRKESQ